MNTARIEDLKRRIQRDPASIAFAQLGEEYRRAGRYREAIETCRAGLRRHPGYLSARVTLGRALVASADLQQAERELNEVLQLAPENLAALRGLADVAERGGDRARALSYYRRAAALAPNDKDLQSSVAQLEAEPEVPVTPPTQPVPPGPASAHAAATAPMPTAESAAARSDAVGPAQEAPPASPQSRLVATLEGWHAAIVADRAKGQATRD